MVTVTEADRVHTLELDRPSQRNALTPDAARALVDALESAVDDGARAVVITGRGEAFCAGGDLQAMADREERPRESFDRVQETLAALIEGILTAPVPVVARVNGDAVGAGTNLAAACDFAYAVEGARFGEVFVKVGLVPDSGGTFLLPALVGLRTAKELAMTGRLFDAPEAADLGLINRAVAPAGLDDAVDDLLDTLADRPTETLGLTKRGLHENLGRPLRDALERESYLQTLAYGTDAHEEGVDAFLSDRRPDFE